LQTAVGQWVQQCSPTDRPAESYRHPVRDGSVRRNVLDARTINVKLAELGVGEDELRADPDGAPSGSGVIVLSGFRLNQLEDADPPPGMFLGSISVGGSEALRVLDELAPGWRTATQQ
jgi:hypothetical protein